MTKTVPSARKKDSTASKLASEFCIDIKEASHILRITGARKVLTRIRKLSHEQYTSELPKELGLKFTLFHMFQDSLTCMKPEKVIEFFEKEDLVEAHRDAFMVSNFLTLLEGTQFPILTELTTIIGDLKEFLKKNEEALILSAICLHLLRCRWP